jgi:hypothetical protein
MTDEEARRLSDCGRGCYIIGGPWIGADSQCPIHGAHADEYITRGEALLAVHRAFGAGYQACISDVDEAGSHELALRLVAQCQDLGYRLEDPERYL